MPLWFNVMNLWHLIPTSDVGLLALTILWFAHGIVFTGVQFGWAVMGLAEPPEGGSGAKRRPVLPKPVPVLQHASKNRRPNP